MVRVACAGLVSSEEAPNLTFALEPECAMIAALGDPVISSHLAPGKIMLIADCGGEERRCRALHECKTPTPRDRPPSVPAATSDQFPDPTARSQAGVRHPQL